MEFYNSHEWARRPQYNSFWEHYKVAERWRKKHAHIVQIAYAKAEPKEEEEAQDELIIATEMEDERSSIASPSTKRHCEESSAGPSEPMEEESDELSQDYIEFRRITLEHRKTREAKRDAEEKQRRPEDAHWIKIDNEEYILADKVGVFGTDNRTLNAPDEQQKMDQRRSHAFELYGKDSQKILAMEAALDMHFNDEFKKRNPPLWPNIPLRF